MLSYKHLMCGHLPSIPGVGERVTVPFFFFLSFVVGCRQIPDLFKTKEPMFNIPFSWGNILPFFFFLLIYLILRQLPQHIYQFNFIKCVHSSFVRTPFQKTKRMELTFFIKTCYFCCYKEA